MCKYYIDITLFHKFPKQIIIKKNLRVIWKGDSSLSPSNLGSTSSIKIFIKILFSNLMSIIYLTLTYFFFNYIIYFFSLIVYINPKMSDIVNC